MKLTILLLATVAAVGCSITPEKRAAMQGLAARMQAGPAAPVHRAPPAVSLTCRASPVNPGVAYCD